MVDLTSTIVPKSDQINADDLVAGPMTVTITKVSGTGNSDQPIAVNFDGDNNKPYKPCKSMRRVMVHVWGKDGNAYVGKSMTIYRDPKVSFGGIETGGIRISHMSGIQKSMTMALTATRASRKPYTVQPLAEAIPEQKTEDKAITMTEALEAQIAKATDKAALEAFMADARAIKQKDWLTRNRPELADRVMDATANRFDALARTTTPTTEADPFPGGTP